MDALFWGLLSIAVSIICLGVSIVVAVRIATKSTNETVNRVFHSKEIEISGSEETKKVSLSEAIAEGVSSLSRLEERAGRIEEGIRKIPIFENVDRFFKWLVHQIEEFEKSLRKNH